MNRYSPRRHLCALWLVVLALVAPTHLASAQTTPNRTLTTAQADRLANLPLACVQQEYPNKLGQTLGGPSDIASPSTLHPAFYG
ncbi:MAG: DUF2891 family protein, partial [Pseudomonadota bacterium]